MKISWRRFAFFKKEAVAEGDATLNDVLGVAAEFKAAAYCELTARRDASTENDEAGSVDAACFFGDDKGGVHATDGQLAISTRVASFGGSCDFLSATLVGKKVCLVAVGSNGRYGLKAWEYDVDSKAATEIEDLDLGEDEPTALAVRGDAKLALVGFKSGKIAMIQLKRKKVAGLLQPAADGCAVTAIVFAELSGGAKDVFVGTESEVLCYTVEGSDAALSSRAPWTDEARQKWRGKARRLDARGCAANCAAFDGEELVVAREDGLYFYTTQERGGATGFDGEKQALACLGQGYVAVASLHAKSRRSEVHVYDLRNKRVAHFYRLAAQQQIVHQLIGGGKMRRTSVEDAYSDVSPPLCSVLVVTKSGSVARLDEKPTWEKLETLYRMNLYPTAIEIAEKANVRPELVKEISKMHADHLYKKCDWEGAVEQYSRTFGHLEPSYVVRRFLEAQRIQSLAAYLEAAHTAESQAALKKAACDPPPRLPNQPFKEKPVRPELTTLLVHCYAKLKDVKKLDKLVTTPEDDPSLKFDTKAAVEALKEAGFIEHALELAKRRGEFEWYVRAQLERTDATIEDAREGLGKMAELPVKAQNDFMRRYGKKLVTNFPEQCTELLMKLCTPVEGEDRPRPETFCHLFIEQPTYLRLFLEYHFRMDKKEATKWLVNTLIEMQLDDWSDTKIALDALEQSASVGTGPLGGQAKPRKPPEERKRLELEAKLRGYQSDVLDLLADEDAAYDKYHALLLVETRQFEPGRVWLYENRMRKEEKDSPALTRGVVNYVLLESYAARKDFRNMLKTCKASRSELLWLQLLEHVAKTVPAYPTEDAASAEKDLFYEKSEELGTVLRVADEEKVLAPQRIIKECAKLPGGVAVDALRPYLEGQLERSFGAMERDRDATEELRASTTGMRQEIHDAKVARVMLMANIPDIAKTPASKIYGTPEAAMIPALLYHAGQDDDDDELEDEDDDDELTAATADDDDEEEEADDDGALAAADEEHKKWAQIKRSQRRSADDHEQFFKELDDEEHGGFETVARYFGKGVIR